jgi:hypothetical protein
MMQFGKSFFFKTYALPELNAVFFGFIGDGSGYTSFLAVTTGLPCKEGLMPDD